MADQINMRRAELAQLLRAILREEDPWQTAGGAHLPFPKVVRGIRDLLHKDLLAFDGNRLKLTHRGKILAQELGANTAPEVRCDLCQGSGIDLSYFEDITAQFTELVRNRPSPTPVYDQGYQTIDSSLKRVALMVAQGDVEQKDIVLLGDDDLISLALALTGLPRSVVVVEIDARLCDFIKQTADRAGLKVEVICQSLTEHLPTNLLHRFDTFLTDPVETEKGLSLFLDKGFACLRQGEGRAGYFGITRIEASIGKWRKWQQNLLQRQAIAFTHILPDFSFYANWESQDERPIPDLPPFARTTRRPWFRSSFFRVETLPEFQPPEDYAIEANRSLYEDEDAIVQVWRSPQPGQASLPSEGDFSPTPFPTQLTLGRHIIAEFWRCRNREPLCELKQVLKQKVSEAGATLLHLRTHRFIPDGFSALALLAESHVSIHAWPEYGYVAVDVFTCGGVNPEIIVEGLKAFLQPEESAKITLERGRGPLMVIPAKQAKMETPSLG